MATVKISQLPAILGANTAATDVIPIVDVSGNITNKITREEFFKNIQSDVEIADKIVHSGDTNTSIRFPAADTVTVETSGAERMRIDSSGNVGIGTSSPSYRLHVADTSLTSTTAGSNIIGRFQSNGSGADVNVQFSDGVANASQVGMVGGDLYVRTNNLERMRVLKTGNVGIGTSSPTADLQIGANPGSNRTFQMGSAGATRFVISTDGTNGLTNIGCTNDSTTGRLAFRTGSALTERMRIDQDGNVGIGTSSPAEILELSQATDGTTLRISSQQNDSAHSTTTPFGALEFYSADASGPGASVRASVAAQFLDASGATTALTFSTSASLGNTERLRIDSSGNVGIGTTSPAQRLDVRSAAANAVQARFGFVSGRGLEISTASVSGTNDAASVLNALGSTAGTMIFQTDSTERMRIDSSGNVGIGTSSPSAALSVVGAAGTNLVSTITSQVNTGSYVGFFDTTTSDRPQVGAVGNNFAVRTGSAERMRIDASGNLLVGKTAPDTSAAGMELRPTVAAFTASGSNPLSLRRNTSDGAVALFFRDGTNVGSISVTTTATAYNTSSDYRLKESIQPIFGASDRVRQLNPVNFAWKADGSRTDGFIAHEVQAVVPQAVTGEKDGEEMQAIDHSKLVPLLTAALQEALTEIAALKARLDAANL